MKDGPEQGLEQLFDRFWDDEQVRQRFLDDPAAVLLEHGLMDLTMMQPEINENKENKIHLIFHGESPDKIHVISHRHPRMSGSHEST